jgi:hypothetical protein
MNKLAANGMKRVTGGKPLALATLVSLIFLGCEKKLPTHQAPPEEMFIFSTALSPTPIENATTRYTDFVYHLRPVGAAEYKTFLPSSISPTKDRSILVKFLVRIPTPALDQEYESYISYQLDGKESLESHDKPAPLRSSDTKASY